MTAAAADRIAGALLGLYVVIQMLTVGLVLLAFVGVGLASAVVGFAEDQLGAVFLGGTFGTLGALASALLFASTLPAVAGTWGLLLRRGWGRPMAGLSALLALPTFPVGTVLGVGILGFIGWAWSLERG